MSLFEWNESLELGIEEIDEQHKKLVRIMNDLYDELLRQNVRRGFYAALRQLREYVQVHFEQEEGLMRRCGYPRLERHIATHDHFARHIDKLVPKAHETNHSRGRREAEELLTYLRDWLVDHILGGDLLFAKFYLARQGDDASNQSKNGQAS